MADKEAIKEAIQGKTILVTGGAGTLGKVVVKELLKLKPQSVRIYSRNEYQQWEFAADLRQETFGFVDITKARFLIGDIRDKDRLYRAMNGVDYVVHAAAMKHIDICAYNPIEAVQTNIMGSINVIDCAIDNGVKNVIAISSDKAVHPVNLYGASKLVMEKLMVEANVYGKTKFSLVRFGNIEDASGTVVEKWRKQHKDGVPLTITDKDMTRFWIAQPLAAEYVLGFLTTMEGGEIFVPKCLPDKIYDMCKRKYPDDQITFTGVRAGEKMHEMLISETEKVLDLGLYWVIK